MSQGSMTKPDTAEGFVLTGRHVLLMLIAFFGVIFAANGVFVTLAVKSFPGEEADRAYVRGLDYDDVLTARAAQGALGWRATLEDVSRDGAGGARIIIAFRNDNGGPVTGLALDGALRAPASDGDVALSFVDLGNGRHEAVGADVRAGAWDLSVAAAGADGEAFEFENRIWMD